MGRICIAWERNKGCGKVLIVLHGKGICFVGKNELRGKQHRDVGKFCVA